MYFLRKNDVFFANLTFENGYVPLKHLSNCIEQHLLGWRCPYIFEGSLERRKPQIREVKVLALLPEHLKFGSVHAYQTLQG